MSDLPEIIRQETQELQKIQSYYDLAGLSKVIENAQSIRKELMNKKTDAYYIDKKDNHIYVKNQYMDNIFKLFYPIHTIKIVSERILTNAWIIYNVEIEAKVGLNLSITNCGAGASRIMIPKEIRAGIKNGTIPIERLSPLDWIDVGNDAKSALTKAISNAQSRFGVCADVYNKGIMPEHIRKSIERTIDKIIETNVVLPMEKINVKRDWSELKSKKGNYLDFLAMLCEKYEVDLETEN